jgi:hypothetical protein
MDMAGDLNGKSDPVANLERRLPYLTGGTGIGPGGGVGCGIGSGSGPGPGNGSGGTGTGLGRLADVIAFLRAILRTMLCLQIPDFK